jgi:phosphonate metabolism protein (transferase hexapeptide repeat family)
MTGGSDPVLAFQDPDSAGKILSAAPLIDPSAQVRECSFGRFSEVGPRCKIAESSFGDYSYIGNDSDVIYTRIGKFCSIAAQVRINPGNHPLARAALNHFTYRASKYGLGADEPEFFDWRRAQKVVIGHDVWIGHGAIILPGTTIGNGAVIGAGAVVTKNVEDFAIVIGTPAKCLRFRFEAEIRAQLNRIAWWDWTDQQLAAALQDFRTLPIEHFCARYSAALDAP